MGAPSENHRYGGGMMAPRHHQQSNAPATPPATARTTLPVTLFCRFHGHFLTPYRRPASVAPPSPTARIPHAPATETVTRDRPEQPDVDDDGGSREGRRLIPVEKREEERDRSERDVHPLPQRF
jgi:hypothetical protein